MNNLYFKINCTDPYDSSCDGYKETRKNICGHCQKDKDDEYYCKNTKVTKAFLERIIPSYIDIYDLDICY
jgi:hypothetical protein